jgi:hypothetical protein
MPNGSHPVGLDKFLGLIAVLEIASKNSGLRQRPIPSGARPHDLPAVLLSKMNKSVVAWNARHTRDHYWQACRLFQHSTVGYGIDRNSR